MVVNWEKIKENHEKLLKTHFKSEILKQQMLKESEIRMNLAFNMIVQVVDVQKEVNELANSLYVEDSELDLASRAVKAGNSEAFNNEAFKNYPLEVTNVVILKYNKLLISVKPCMN